MLRDTCVPPEEPGLDQTKTAVPAGPRNGGEADKEAGELRTEFYHNGRSGPSESVSLRSLAGLPQWVAWKEVDGRKLPFNPATGKAAKSDGRTTWATRAAAETRALMLLKDGSKGGVGVMLGPILGNPEWCLGGVDLDSCRDPDTDDLEPWATEIVERFGSYPDVSPSGKGVKVFCLYRATDLPAIREAMGTTHRKAWSRGSHCEIALDVSNRYYAVTDQPLDDVAALIGPADVLSPVPLEDLLWLIRDAGPAFARPEASTTRDESGSGYGYRFFLDQVAQGATYEAALEAMRADDGPAGEWANRASDRELERTWGNAAAKVQNRRADKVDEEDVDDPYAEFADILGPKSKPERDINLNGFALTEKSVADAFRTRHKGKLLFNHDSRQWHEWTGFHWRPERTMLAFAWAVKACADVAKSDPTNAQARVMARAGAARGVEAIAKSDRAFAVTSDRFDRNPWLLGTPGGTVDLRTGELKPARQADHVTKLTAVAPIPLDRFTPERDCPRFLAFLTDATADDPALIRFLQQWFGYTLTGDVREEALLFGHGPGGSGKSTLFNTIGDLLADYCVNIPIETLTETKHERHPTELARLDGARMAWASETEQGRRWAQNRITELTGGDTITARFMRGDFFSFKPQFKLGIIGNNQPSLRSVDAAIKRRFNVVPFRHRPERVDDTLKAKLREEWSGILSWLLLGCLDWQTHGLVRPKVVTDYTREYLSEQDVFQRWLDCRCDVHRAYSETTERLWESWSRFAHAEGESPGSKTQTFPDSLREHDFSPAQNVGPKRVRGWKGLRVRNDAQGSDFDDLPDSDDGGS